MDAVAKGDYVELGEYTYDLTKTLRVTRSGTSIIGQGEKTILRMAFGADAYGPLIALPAEWSRDFGGNPPPASMRVRDVEIAHLTIDGRREGHPNTYGSERANTLRFGIQVTTASDAWLHHLKIIDIAGDAISVGNGSAINEDPKVEDVTIERAGRNGLHLGSSSGARIRRVIATDTPGVYWSESGAGNGIDIETEGNDPRVLDTEIEDCDLTRVGNRFAGCGLQIARSFGDVDGVKVRRTRTRNHQVFARVTNSRNVLIDDCDIESDPLGVNNVTGGGIYLECWEPGMASAKITRTRFALLDWEWYAHYLVGADGPGEWEISDCEMFGGLRIFWGHGRPTRIRSRRNRWRPYAKGPHKGVFFEASDPARHTIDDQGSQRA